MSSDVISTLRQVMEADSRIRAAGPPISVALDGEGGVTLDGEVVSVAAKRLALDRAARLPDVLTVVDRLRVAPIRRFTDEQIRRRLLDLFVEDAAFSDYEFVSSPRRSAALRRSTSKPRIEFQVEDGVVKLTGRVSAPLHKRLAGVFAWWTPGTRDVLNLLEVEPAVPDGDEQIADAIRTVMDKDPLISIVPDVSVREAVASLSGTAANADEREAAEADAWYVFGVHDVVNSIQPKR